MVTKDYKLWLQEKEEERQSLCQYLNHVINNGGPADYCKLLGRAWEEQYAKDAAEAVAL